ncbi:MAG: phosphatase PAP2 family protein [Thermoleophilia bacterium]|nr:phosphatase PAP2 family protein [Thermoleophilia bacterium]
MNRPLAVTGVLLLVAALAAATLVDQVGAPPFDRWITLHVDRWRDLRFWGAVFRAASRVGFATWLVPAIVVWAVLIGVARRSIWPVLLGLVANPLVSIVNQILKQTFHRPRPSFDQYQAVGGFSLPSGHAASSAAFAVAVAFSLPAGRARRIALALGVLFAFTVGLSRIVLGVHYTTDVAIGWAEGAGLALLIASVTTARAPLPSMRRPRRA